MTTEEIKCRLMEILCEATNDQRQPVDTLNDMMENIKNLTMEVDREGTQMTNFEKYKQKMTVEELGAMVSAMGDAGSKCECFCPCYEFCKASSKTGNPHDVWKVYPSAPNESECTGAVREWAKRESEDTKYIVRCELDVGACMFSSFWNGRRFIREGEGNAKVFDRRESAEEEMNRFRYSPRDYSILETTEQER